MPFIPQVDLARATEEQHRAHETEIRQRGRMTNMKRTLLHSPPALRIYGEWFTLRDELVPAIGERAVLVLCLAISESKESEVGMAFMRRGLAALGSNDAGFDHLALADFEAFGREFATDPKSISVSVWERLSTVLSNKALVDLTALAGIMVATIAFMDAVGTEPDHAPGD